MLSVIARDNIRRPFLLATLITMTYGVSAQAQEAASEEEKPVVLAQNLAANSNLVGGGIETVTVSAQKREENIQDVPQAITAIRGSDVANMNLLSPTDLGRLVPNFSAQSSSGRNSKPRWFIRGMGSNDPSVTLESAVGVYQDEVYIGLPSAQNFPLYDLARVEVLRGPQGTLWGKNTTGGAVSFISQAPSFESSGYAKANLGDYGAQILQGAYGGGLIDNFLAARASFYYERGPTYAKNLYTNQNNPDLTDVAARIQFLAQFGDTAEYTLNLHTRQLTGGGAISYPIGINANGADNTGFIPVYGTNPQVGDPYYAGLSDLTNRTYGATGKGAWHFGNGISLVSISNLEWSSVYSRITPGNPPVGNPDQTSTFGTTGYHQFSQELRLESPNDGPFTWLIGYAHFENQFNVAAVSATTAPTTRTAYTRTGLVQNGDSDAVFASAKYRFTDALALTIGIRDTFDTKNVQENTRQGGARGSVIFRNAADPFPLAAVSSTLSNISLSDGRTWNVLTWDATPEYQIDDNIKAYARVARGFRAGAFNPVITTVGVPTPVIAKTNPEVLFSYEFGAKTNWFDNRLIFNASAFHYTLKDVQLNVQQANPTGVANATTSTIQNAAGGWIQGLEFEIETTPIENLHISSGVSFLESRYKNFFTFQGSTLTDASGNEFYRTPKFTGTIAASYVIPLDEIGVITLDTDWSYRSHIFHNAVVQNDPVQETPGYGIGNARISYLTPNGKFEFSVYSNNILDQSWKILAQVPNNGAYPVSLGQPRTTGASVQIRF